MSKFDLVITIEGKPGSGKTSAAIVAARALRDVGFIVAVDDMDMHQLGRKIVEIMVDLRIENKAFTKKEIKIKTQIIRR